MTKFVADNLLFLREQYPEIYKLVCNRTYNREKYVAETSKHGNAIVSVRTEDGKLRSVYSRYNPQLEAERWAFSVFEKVNGMQDVFIYGFGFGYHLEAFINIYPDKRIFVHEPQLDMFLCAMEYRDLRDILGNKRVAMFGIGKEFIVQYDSLAQFFSRSDEQVAVLEMPVYHNLFPNEIQNYRQALKEVTRSLATSLRTLTRFRQEWTRNKILNMAINLETPSIRGLMGSCVGIPAIIVGSGPSLGMEVETLQSLKNRALIIAAGTSIQALLKYNIKPELVVVMDASEINFKAFEPLDLENIPLLYIPDVHSSILRKKYNYLMHAFFNSDTPTAYFMQLTKNDPVFQSTGTVSGTAIQVALYLGCSEIVFIGQDFSFPGEQYYAEGVVHRSQETLALEMQQSAEWIENVQGLKIRTNGAMNVLREGIERLIDQYPDSAFYNASRVGAVIKGTKLKSLDQLLEERKNIDLGDDWFIQKIKQLLQPYPEDRCNSVINRVVEFYEKSTVFTEQFEKLKKHVNAAKANLDRCNIDELQCWLIDFEDIWKAIIDDESFKYVYGFFLQRELNYMDRHWYQMKEDAHLPSKASKLLELFEPLMRSWDEVNSLLRTRLEELLEDPLFREKRLQDHRVGSLGNGPIS